MNIAYELTKFPKVEPVKLKDLAMVKCPKCGATGFAGTKESHRCLVCGMLFGVARG